MKCETSSTTAFRCIEYKFFRKSLSPRANLVKHKMSVIVEGTEPNGSSV